MNNNNEPWKINLIDTGLNTMTGGRLRRVSKYLDNEDFCFTYGDGVSNVDIKALVDHHKRLKKIATLTAVSPIGRFGALKIENDNVLSFDEKPEDGHGLINGGFFVLSPKILDYIDDDSTIFEREPLEKLATSNELGVYKHRGFWQCMDTIRDKQFLENLWNKKQAPWKVW